MTDGEHMAIRLERRDIGYTIISRFEGLLRLFLFKKINMLFSDYYEGIPQGIEDKVKERVEACEITPEEFMEALDFPDLKEIIFYNNAYNIFFPSMRISKDTFDDIMSDLYLIRCKIAHVRGYFTSFDLDKLIEGTKNISSEMESDGEPFLQLLMELEHDPTTVTISCPISFFNEGNFITPILNNIPIPDYEYEGGFVGREEDIKAIRKLLEGALHRVITITGAGGVGKSSLALRIIQRLLQAESCIFDGVVWVSAKETTLSAVGIEGLEPTVKDYMQLLDTISDVLGYGINGESIEQKEEYVNTIFDIHKCILIVIDNLETITDERIINFILDSHPSIKILITSRKGLGQVERRHELRQLKEKEAVYLFRLIARDKNLNKMASLSEDVIRTYVKRLYCYPLAIKWVIGQVALGKDINDLVNAINETNSDISYFCFDQIYKDLSEEKKKILCALTYFEEPSSPGVLKYVVDIAQDDFNDGVRDLILLSLIIPEQDRNDQNEIFSRYTLLPLTRGYVRQQLDKDSVMKRDLSDRLRTVETTLEEAQRAKKQYRFTLADLGAITEEEKVAAMIAQTAFQKYETGRYSEACEDYKRATEIAPRFASLYRNWAVMESREGHWVEADRLMEKAKSISPKDPQIWLTWGSMKKKQDKIKDALDYYERAYSLAPKDNFIISSLGQVKSRVGECEEADRLFRMALESNDNGNGSNLRHNIINRSSLADNLKRWAEFLCRDRSYAEAEKKLLEAYEQINSVIMMDKTDVKSQDLFRDIVKDLGYFYKLKNPQKAIEFFCLGIVDKPIRYKEAKLSTSCRIEVATLAYKLGDVETAKKWFPVDIIKRNKYIHNDDARVKTSIEVLWHQLYDQESLERGAIINVNPSKGLVIIESITSPGYTYTGLGKHFTPVINDISNDLIGKNVTFAKVDYVSIHGTKKVAKYINIID